MVVATVHMTEFLGTFPTVVIREKASAYDETHSGNTEGIKKLIKRVEDDLLKLQVWNKF